MSTITFDAAYAALRSIAAGQPDKVAVCEYVKTEYDGNEVKSIKPECLVGVYIVEHLHIDPAYVRKFEGGATRVFQTYLSHIAVEPQAVFFLHLAQMYQDGSGCSKQRWENAVNKAKATMDMLFVLDYTKWDGTDTTVLHSLARTVVGWPDDPSDEN